MSTEYHSNWPKNVKKPTAYVLVGLPGSGKSTWAKKGPKAPLPIASTDKFIEQYAKENTLPYDKAFKKHYKKATQMMKEQVAGLREKAAPFIWDQVNLTPKERAAIYKLLHDTHRIVFVCFDTPLEECLTRHAKRDRDGGEAVDEKRIKKLASTMSLPDKSEPHDKIVIIKQ